VSHPINVPALAHSTRPAVEIIDGKPTTTSLEVARVFGKRHDDVLKTIRNLRKDLPEECLRNFAETSATVQQPNGGTREVPAWQLTRDGFTLLAMGFTGKRALAFKLSYIAAFNRMEAALHGPPLTESRAQGELTLDVTDAAQMQSARQAALAYFDKAQAAVKTGGAWPGTDSLQEVLRGVLANAFLGRRWAVHFDPKGQMSLHPVAGDALNLTLAEAARRIESGDLAASNEELLHLAQASNARLMKRLAARPARTG